MAASICVLSNPISTICCTAASRPLPNAKADGSLKAGCDGASVVVVVVDAAGVGVSGTTGAADLAVAGAGAAGAETGVDGLAGVEGAAAEDDPDAVAALGYEYSA